MTQIEHMQPCVTSVLPADKVDDGFVLEAGVCSTDASLLVGQFQDIVLERQLPAHLTAADGRVAVPNAHG